MKYHFHFGILMLLGGLFCLSSCGEKLPTVDQRLAYLPADAATIVRIMPQKCLVKSHFETIDSSDLGAFWMENIVYQSVLLQKILKAPYDSGLLLEAPMYLSDGQVLLKNDPGKEEEWRLVFSVGDAETFEKLIQQSEVLRIERADSCRIAHFKEAKLYWNENVGVLSNQVERSPRDLLAAFNAAKTNQLATNVDLGQCLAREADLSIWTNLDFLANDPKMKSLMALAGFSSSLLKRNHTHTHCFFEAGRISAETDYHLNSELLRELDFLWKDAPPPDLSSHFEQEGLLALFVLALDAKGFRQLFQEHPLLQIPISRPLRQVGLTMKDLFACLEGDVAIAYYGTGTSASSLLALPLRDPSQAEKLLDKLQKNHFIEARGTLWKLRARARNTDATHMLLHKNALLISDDLERLRRLQQRNKQAPDSTTAPALASLPLSAHLNIDQADSLRNEYLSKILQSIHVKSDLQKAHWDIRFRDPATNSLQQLREWEETSPSQPPTM